MCLFYLFVKRQMTVVCVFLMSRLSSPNIVCVISVLNVYLYVVVVHCLSCIDVEHSFLFSLHTLPFDPCPHFLSSDWLSLQEVRNQDRSNPSCLFSSPVTFILSFPGCHSRPFYFLSVRICILLRFSSQTGSCWGQRSV